MFSLWFRVFKPPRPVGGKPPRVRQKIQGKAFQLTRPVWGEPWQFSERKRQVQTFQLTRPVWGEPYFRVLWDVRQEISTHSPRVGRTKLSSVESSLMFNFNSLAPCGANRFDGIAEDGLIVISTHSPRVGRTRRVVLSLLMSKIFQLTRPVWGEPRAYSFDTVS